QDPPVDLDGVDRRRAALHSGFQRLPPLPRCEDRPGVLDARRVRRRLGLDAGGRRQGVPRRRGRRRRDPAGGQGKEGARGDEHGQRRLRHAGARARHAVPEQPESAVRVGDGEMTGLPRRHEDTKFVGFLRGCVLSCFRGYLRKREDTKHSSLLRVFVISWLAISLPLSAQQSSPNWPQFRGNPSLTGVAATAPPATLALKWTYDAGEAVE